MSASQGVGAQALRPHEPTESVTPVDWGEAVSTASSRSKTRAPQPPSASRRVRPTPLTMGDLPLPPVRLRLRDPRAVSFAAVDAATAARAAVSGADVVATSGSSSNGGCGGHGVAEAVAPGKSRDTGAARLFSKWRSRKATTVESATTVEATTRPSSSAASAGARRPRPRTAGDEHDASSGVGFRRGWIASRFRTKSGGGVAAKRGDDAAIDTAFHAAVVPHTFALRSEAGPLNSVTRMTGPLASSRSDSGHVPVRAPRRGLSAAKGPWDELELQLGGRAAPELPISCHSPSSHMPKTWEEFERLYALGAIDVTQPPPLPLDDGALSKAGKLAVMHVAVGVGRGDGEADDAMAPAEEVTGRPTTASPRPNASRVRIFDEPSADDPSTRARHAIAVPTSSPPPRMRVLQSSSPPPRSSPLSPHVTSSASLSTSRSGSVASPPLASGLVSPRGWRPTSFGSPYPGNHFTTGTRHRQRSHESQATMEPARASSEWGENGADDDVDGVAPRFEARDVTAAVGTGAMAATLEQEEKQGAIQTFWMLREGMQAPLPPFENERLRTLHSHRLEWILGETDKSLSSSHTLSSQQVVSARNHRRANCLDPIAAPTLTLRRSRSTAAAASSSSLVSSDWASRTKSASKKTAMTDSNASASTRLHVGGDGGGGIPRSRNLGGLGLECLSSSGFESPPSVSAGLPVLATRSGGSSAGHGRSLALAAPLSLEQEVGAREAVTSKRTLLQEALHKAVEATVFGFGRDFASEVDAERAEVCLVYRDEVVRVAVARREGARVEVAADDTHRPRGTSLESHAILNRGQAVVVADAKSDARFHAFVSADAATTAESVARFWAIAPVLSLEGMPIATLSFMSPTPQRHWTKAETTRLESLAAELGAAFTAVRSREYALKHSRLQQSLGSIERQAAAIRTCFPLAGGGVLSSWNLRSAGLDVGAATFASSLLDEVEQANAIDDVQTRLEGQRRLHEQSLELAHSACASVCSELGFEAAYLVELPLPIMASASSTRSTTTPAPSRVGKATSTALELIAAVGIDVGALESQGVEFDVLAHERGTFEPVAYQNVRVAEQLPTGLLSGKGNDVVARSWPTLPWWWNPRSDGEEVAVAGGCFVTGAMVPCERHHTDPAQSFDGAGTSTWSASSAAGDVGSSSLGRCTLVALTSDDRKVVEELDVDYMQRVAALVGSVLPDAVLRRLDVEVDRRDPREHIEAWTKATGRVVVGPLASGPGSHGRASGPISPGVVVGADTGTVGRGTYNASTQAHRSRTASSQPCRPMDALQQHARLYGRRRSVTDGALTEGAGAGAAAAHSSMFGAQASLGSYRWDRSTGPVAMSTRALAVDTKLETPCSTTSDLDSGVAWSAHSATPSRPANELEVLAASGDAAAMDSSCGHSGRSPASKYSDDDFIVLSHVGPGEGLASNAGSRAQASLAKTSQAPSRKSQTSTLPRRPATSSGAVGGRWYGRDPSDGAAVCSNQSDTSATAHHGERRGVVQGDVEREEEEEEEALSSSLFFDGPSPLGPHSPPSFVDPFAASRGLRRILRVSTRDLAPAHPHHPHVAAKVRQAGESQTLEADTCINPDVGHRAGEAIAEASTPVAFPTGGRKVGAAPSRALPSLPPSPQPTAFDLPSSTAVAAVAATPSWVMDEMAARRNSSFSSELTHRDVRVATRV